MREGIPHYRNLYPWPLHLHLRGHQGHDLLGGGLGSGHVEARAKGRRAGGADVLACMREGIPHYRNLYPWPLHLGLWGANTVAEVLKAGRVRRAAHPWRASRGGGWRPAGDGPELGLRVTGGILAVGGGPSLLTIDSVYRFCLSLLPMAVIQSRPSTACRLGAQILGSKEGLCYACRLDWVFFFWKAMGARPCA
jgi:hypothetical protein